MDGQIVARDPIRMEVLASARDERRLIACAGCGSIPSLDPFPAGPEFRCVPALAGQSPSAQAGTNLVAEVRNRSGGSSRRP